MNRPKKQTKQSTKQRRRRNGYVWRCNYCGHIWIRTKRKPPTRCAACRGYKINSEAIKGQVKTIRTRHHFGFTYLGREDLGQEERKERKT